MSLRFAQYAIQNELDVKKMSRNQLRLAVKEMDKDHHKPKLDELGNKIYVTQQDCKDSTDINMIIKRYPVRVIRAQMAMHEAKFADVTGFDYQKAQNLIQESKMNFMKLDPDVRAKFNNNPGEYLEYLARPEPVKDMVDDKIKTPKRTKQVTDKDDKNKDGVVDKLE
jgi:hypothetical protein